MWRLEASEDLESGPLAVQIAPGTVKTLGRALPADVILDAPLVSRLHCRLTAGARGLEIVDLDSTNGTYINDRRIKRAHLTPGDRLRIGRVLLTVTHESVES
ncbi:MAG: FHA domain-containing protein [Vicinamibacterales bacterium]